MPEPDAAAVTTGFHTTLDTEGVIATIADAGLILRAAYDEDELPDDVDTALWKYLTRHLIRHEPDQQTRSVAAGSARKDYTGSFGDKLDATSPGQTVLMIDSEHGGELADMNDETEDVFFRSV